MFEARRSGGAVPSSAGFFLARVAVLIALLMALGLGLSAPASASPYPPSFAVLDLSERNLPPSTPFVATVAGCRPGENVTILFDGNDPVTVVCGSDGIATVTLTSPSTPGTFDVTAILGTTGITLVDSISVSVTPAPTTPAPTTPAPTNPNGVPADPAAPDTSTRPDASLPRTGSGGVTNTLFIGGGLVLFGAMFAYVARVRRQAASAA